MEPSPRGPPVAAATWRYLSDLRPAKLGMRAAVPGIRTAARRVVQPTVSRRHTSLAGRMVALTVRTQKALHQSCPVAMPGVWQEVISSCRSAAGVADVREQRRSGSAPPEAGTAAEASGTPMARAAVIAEHKAPRSAELERVRGRCVRLHQLLKQLVTCALAQRISCATRKCCRCGHRAG